MLFFCSSLTEQQISIGHDKPNEADYASMKMIQPSEICRFLNSVIKAHHQLQSKAARFAILAAGLNGRAPWYPLNILQWASPIGVRDGGESPIQKKESGQRARAGARAHCL